MKKLAIPLAEALLLFGALFFCLPYIPSHEMAELPLFPAAAFAVVLFAASRILRWQLHWWWVLVEVFLFVIFVYVLHLAVNILYSA